ncbi:MAG: hypothetical protein AB4368_00320 [Xenococcaceae cyanobacterium]
MWHYKDQKRYGIIAHALACSRPFSLIIGMAIFGFLSYPRPKTKTPPSYVTNPKTAQDYVDRAASVMVQRDLTYEKVEKALADCERAVDLLPNKAWTHHCRVNPLAYLGRKEEARKELDKVLAMYQQQGPKRAAEIYERRGHSVIDSIKPLSPRRKS